MRPSTGIRGSVIVTTSHRPSRRTRSFARDLVETIPGAVKINRGKKSLKDLEAMMRTSGFKILLVVNTWKANPGRIDIYRLSGDFLEPLGSLVVRSARLSREQGSRPCGMTSPSVEIACPGEVCEAAGKLVEELILSAAGSRREQDSRSGSEVVHISGDDRIYIWFSRDGEVCGPRIGVRRILTDIQGKSVHLSRS